ncbi:polysaccharide pyruvyl transferase family protein [Guptibacillus sedimenti]|uniref:polysaccharide pyruvyl transferase family protein n=1 Tax=Guptibacillus sedimenti TaxID=3025680 RepID=UPI00235E973D|nr:polysaccharide pyruvyl transferase family protein [Pseudalkalibacillus sedimenti]
MKRIFVDIYLQYNLGDDLFLDILAEKYPETQFTINYLGKNYNQFISKYKNVVARKYTFLNKIEQRLKIKDSITNFDSVADEHDGLLFIGGSIFREEQYHKSLYSERMKLIKEFKKRNKAVFILGANFGPYTSNEFIDDYKKLFKLCDDVCFRDVSSFTIFEDIPQVRIAPDIVFQMKTEQYKPEEKTNTIGFSIIDVNHKKGLSSYSKEYIDSTVKTIDTFVEKGYECCLMSFCEKEGDLKVVKAIMSSLDSNTLNSVKIYNYKGNLKEAITLIASFKLIVAARFHANILGMLLGSKIIPIIYSDKTSNLLKDLNMSDLGIDMLNIQFQHDENYISRALNSKTDLSGVIINSSNQFANLNRFLKGRYLDWGEV